MWCQGSWTPESLLDLWERKLSVCLHTGGDGPVFIYLLDSRLRTRLISIDINEIEP